MKNNRLKTIENLIIKIGKIFVKKKRKEKTMEIFIYKKKGETKGNYFKTRETYWKEEKEMQKYRSAYFHGN